jgi:hypothetical protein
MSFDYTVLTDSTRRNWGPFFGFSNFLEKFQSPVLLSPLSFQPPFNKIVKLFEFTIFDGFLDRYAVFSI